MLYINVHTKLRSGCLIQAVNLLCKLINHCFQYIHPLNATSFFWRVWKISDTFIILQIIYGEWFICAVFSCSLLLFMLWKTCGSTSMPLYTAIWCVYFPLNMCVLRATINSVLHKIYSNYKSCAEDRHFDVSMVITKFILHVFAARAIPLFFTSFSSLFERAKKMVVVRITFHWRYWRFEDASMYKCHFLQNII